MDVIVRQRCFACLLLFIDQCTAGLALWFSPMVLQEAFFLDFPFYIGTMIVYPLCGALSSPFFGYLWDRWNRKHTWMIAMIGVGCALFLYAGALWYASRAIFILARVIHGSFGAITLLAISQMILPVDNPKKRQSLLHLFTCVMGSAWLCGYLIIAGMNLFSLFYPPWMYTLFGVVLIYFATYIARHGIFLPTRSYETPLPSPFFHKELRIFRITMHLLYVGFFILLFWTLPLVKEHFTLSHSALSMLCIALPTVWALTGVVAYHCLIRFVDPIILTLWSLFLASLFVFLTTSIQTTFSLFAIMLLLSIAAASLAFTNLLSLLIAKSHDSSLGLNMGLTYTMIFLAQGTVPWLGIFVPTQFLLYIAGIAFLLACAILFTYLIRRNPQMLRY